MSEIFISHVEEDADIALEIALGLEEAGYTIWCYEIDSILLSVSVFRDGFLLHPCVYGFFSTVVGDSSDCSPSILS